MSFPILYGPGETAFENNGFGVLSDAISCEITEERNGAFELEMEYPISGIHFGEIKNLCLLLAKPNPFDQAQPFRVYRITKPLNGICTVYGQHVSYDLSGIPVSPFSSNGIIDAFSKLKSNSVVSNPFEFSTDKSTVANMNIQSPMTARSVLGGSQGTILDVYGGEYKFDRFTVQLLNNRGKDGGVHIRYGKNLTDLKQEENCASVYSAVYPYWSGTVDENPVLVTLPEKTIACEGTYPIVRVLSLDLSQNFEDAPTVDQLRTAAQSYIRNNKVGVPTVSLDVSFADLSKYDEYKGQNALETVMLCDTVSVDFPALGVSATAKVVKTVYNVILDKYESVSIGDARSNIADSIAQQEGEIQSTRENVRSDIQKAQDNATRWITSGKGHMVAVRDDNGQWIEQMSLDTTDISTAKSVWRWNNGGFGHSSTGVNGPYEVAMTRDGAINASMITTGELNANIIKTGRIESRVKGGPYFDLDSGTLHATELISKDSDFAISVETDAINHGMRMNDGSRYVSDFLYNENSGLWIGSYKDLHMQSNGYYDAKSVTNDFNLEMPAYNQATVSAALSALYSKNGVLDYKKLSVLNISTYSDNYSSPVAYIACPGRINNVDKMSSIFLFPTYITFSTEGVERASIMSDGFHGMILGHEVDYIPVTDSSGRKAMVLGYYS